MKFKKGCRVKLRKDSELYHQRPEVIGTAKRDFSYDWTTIEFDDGYSNSYRQQDLELVSDKVDDWQKELE